MENTAELNRLELAHHLDVQAGSGWQGHNKGSMVMGWCGSKLKRNRLFAELGFESEEKYRDSRGFARSTWYRMVRIADAFSDRMTLEEFVGMKIDNAEQLGKVPLSHRFDADLIEGAKKQAIERYPDLLAEFATILAGKPKSETRYPVNHSMVGAQKEAYELHFHSFMDAAGITDENEGLELMAAECAERVTLVGHMRHIVGECFSAANSRDYRTVADVQDTLINMGKETQHVLDLVIGKSAPMKRVS